MSRNLIIFEKLPIKGLVKTRLIGKELTDNIVTDLYECFLIDSLQLALETQYDGLYWAIYPNDLELANKVMKKVDSKEIDKISVMPQEGSNFGERFYNTLQSFEKYKTQNLVIIETDIPQLQPSTINKAFNILESGKGIILGPSQKGDFIY
ncbi:MAG: DUF2064 domain-containing protein [Candidatus Helarchaeota archaeon]